MIICNGFENNYFYVYFLYIKHNIFFIINLLKKIKMKNIIYIIFFYKK